jgi:translocation and assembly module TamB
MENGKLKRTFLKVLKVFGWITLSIIVLLVAIIFAIRIPTVQNKIVQKAITFLEGKIGTEVRLAYVSISFPKTIVLEGLYLEDQSRDTLLYAGELSINTDLWALTQRRITLKEVTLDSLSAFIDRDAKDSTFNFDYIVKAFQDTTDHPAADTTVAPWDFSLGNINLHAAHIAFVDPTAGNDLSLRVGALEIEVDKFDLNKSVIAVDEVNLSDVVVSFEQSKAPVTHQIHESAQTIDKPFPYDLGFSTINLLNIKASYTHYALGQTIRANLHEGTIDAEKFDLRNQEIDLNEVSLTDVFFMYHQQKIDVPEAESISQYAPERTKPWVINLDKISLKKNIVQYYDFNKPILENGVDFSHLWIEFKCKITPLGRRKRAW